ncbi:tRNA (adenosine(37)-N6)-dimethylallyltransferase MiaA [Candidatus Dojkabacteria bacterium]|nr:tRNA (adenosine(37)-N6)-dimethylallyltransferase MiaA [Candidatus Dojkabacteria bacterium]
MEKIVIIGGLTASGKTALAVKLAKKYNGELINADSRQIYKYLDIGTNKDGIITTEQGSFIDKVPIHLVSFLEPNQRYSVYDFKSDAIKHIEDILSRKKLPIIVGGTGLYIDSIIKNYKLETTSSSAPRAELESKSLPELQQIANQDYPESYLALNKSDQSNKRRLIRLIERQGIHNISKEQSQYEYLFLYPKYTWKELLVKIETRVEGMFKEGLVAETKRVLNLGFSKNSVALQGIGYKQVIEYLEGNFNSQKCIDLVKIAHRQYAKRQRTWFEGKSRNYDLNIIGNFEDAVRAVDKFLII